MARFPENDFTPQYPSIGLRDSDHESDAILNLSWVHTFNSKLLLTVSPFYHYNAANYTSSPDGHAGRGQSGSQFDLCRRSGQLQRECREK